MTHFRFLALALFAAFLPAAWGQGTHEFTATCAGADTTAGKTCTVQLPASATRWVALKGVFIQCSAACTVAQARDGSAASATAQTVRPLNPNGSWMAAPAAAVYAESNAGAGTPVGPTSLAVGASPSFQTLDLRGVWLEGGAATAQNYTVTVTLTGNYVVTFQWEERPRP